MPNSAAKMRRLPGSKRLIGSAHPASSISKWSRRSIHCARTQDISICYAALDSKLKLHSRPKALSIFSRSNECLHHLGGNEVTVELIQLRQPEIVTTVIRVRRRVRIAAEIIEVLRQHEHPVDFLLTEDRV